jgi:hypothetical protein
MNLVDLSRRRATLEALRLDLPRWYLAEEAGTEPSESRPIVAIDWSEIYCYAMQEPPREDDSEDYFAAHYAGLNYLLFQLRCRPVLLPPYAVEMKTFVEMIETRAIAPARLIEIETLGERYDDLLQEIGRLQQQYPLFSEVVGGNLSAAEHLDDEAWDFLETLLKKSLPSIFLDFQDATLGAMQALKTLLGATSGSVGKRLASLSTLGVISEGACKRSLGGWYDWNAEMDSQRPRLERQNRADALALAYLQALHQASYWSDTPVFFASRSPSMLQVMENHAGEFEPIWRPDPDISRAIQSSWRSWDYFAELGYYSNQFRTMGDEGAQLMRSSVDQDLAARIAKIDHCIALVRRGSSGNAAIQFMDWETLRGSFDLEGLGKQRQWDRIRARKPRAGTLRVGTLVDLLNSVLSAKDSNAFIAKRGALANSLLTEIAKVLESFPPDLSLAQSNGQFETSNTTGALTQIVRECLDITLSFERYIAKDSMRNPAISHHIVNLLSAITRARDTSVSMQKAKELLQLIASLDVASISAGARDWLIGVGFYYRSSFDDSLKFLPSWLETEKTNAGADLALVTRAICADAYSAQRDHDQGMKLLLEINADDLASAASVLAWHCMKAQLLLEWMDPAKEHYEIFPKPGGQSGDVAIMLPMVKPTAMYISSSDSLANLRFRAADAVMRLAARYVPENLPALAEADKTRKIMWFQDNKSEFEKIEAWYLSEAEAKKSAHAFHTLGYYRLKMNLVYEGRRWEDAMEFLYSAEKLAEQNGDRRTEHLIADHLILASTLKGDL